MEEYMKKMLLFVFCVGLCSLFTGCSMVSSKSSCAKVAAENCNSNLTLEFVIEQNGVALDRLSYLVAGKKSTSANTVFTVGEDMGGLLIRINNIKKISSKNCLVDYSINLRIPVKLGPRRIQSTDLSSSSSINAELGQQVCLYSNKEYKIKMLISKAGKTCIKP